MQHSSDKPIAIHTAVTIIKIDDSFVASPITSNGPPPTVNKAPIQKNGQQDNMNIAFNDFESKVMMFFVRKIVVDFLL